MSNVEVSQAESLTKTLIVIWISFFNVIGQFGNFNLIVITIREKELQTKSGTIVSLNFWDVTFQDYCWLLPA